jgi:hypothetical protein
MFRNKCSLEQLNLQTVTRSQMLAGYYYTNLEPWQGATRIYTASLWPNEADFASRYSNDRTYSVCIGACTEGEAIPSLIVDYCEIYEKSPPALPQEGSTYEGTKGDGCYTTVV